MSKKKSLGELEQNADSKFEKSFSGAKGFVYSFSKLDIEGVKNVLSDNCRHGGYPKANYVELIEDAFMKQFKTGDELSTFFKDRLIIYMISL